MMKERKHSMPDVDGIVHNGDDERLVENNNLQPSRQSVLTSRKKESSPASIGVTTQTPKQKFRYYDLKRNWRKVEPHLSNGFLNHVLVHEFNKFTFGRWGKTFKRGEYPRNYESADWSGGHKGKEP